MRNALSLPATLRDRLALAVLLPAVVAVSALTAAGLRTDAVAQRFVDKLGVDGVSLRLSDLVATVLAPAEGAGQSEINRLLVAVVAIVLLGAFVYFLLAIFKTLGGRRGGVESILTVVFALVVGIAGLEVLS